MSAVILTIAVVLGLAIGSFLNVVIYRVPAGKSIVSPPSACPHCEQPIRQFDNVPVISWLVLRGRCRDCSEPISVRYPLVEAGTAVAFFLVTLNRVDSIARAVTVTEVLASVLLLVALLYLLSISIALAAIDLETHRLPDILVLPAYLVGGVLLAAAALFGGEGARLPLAGIGLLASLLFYFLLAFGYRGGMGLGDVKLSGVLGMYLGWFGLGPLLIGSFAPFMLGGVFAIVLITLSRAGRKSKIPFGPWMLAGAWVGILAGEVLFDKYLEAFGLR